MTNNLHEFVPPFTLYLNVENAQNPVQKHFEKTNLFVSFSYLDAHKNTLHYPNHQQD